MQSEAPLISFRPVTDEHRGLLRRWLSSAHAQEWWGDTEDELALIYDDKGEHEPYIAYVDGRPVAYIQCWWPANHPEVPWQHSMSPTTRGIDITIDEAQDLGRGLGPLIVRHFAAKLLAEGATRLVIDPDSANARAIAAYRKAGFRPFGNWHDGQRTDVLMELLPEDFKHGSDAIRN